MHVAVISPIQVCKALNHWQRPYHMALAHLVLDSKDYREYHRELTDKHGRYVILDNSLMERNHQALDINYVMQAAEMINASEIVLPDVFRSGPGTIQSTRKAIHQLRTSGHDFDRIALAAVVHGRTVDEWYHCYNCLASMPEVNTLHIPKVMDALWPYGGRAGLLRWLAIRADLRSKNQDHHLLGIWSSPLELLQTSDLKWIRSIDTALPVQAGLQNVRFDIWTGIPEGFKKPKRPDYYFGITCPPDDAALEDAKFNTHVLDCFSKGTRVLPL